ncbi:hypothetical protein A3J91_03005 [Candidatus Peribacteria bacterium RIFOXYC2_FULL_58_10]|nr:MAG: hypothetical protein A3J91_03005 [Candidatus Peribacteria bacterium RIFOXYC2_FULL_58_10]
MLALLRSAGRLVRSTLGLDSVRFRGSTLPIKSMRFCGAHFHDDEAFLSSGEAEAKRLQKEFELAKESAVLDIGCGTGRLPIGILSIIGEIAAYRGVDVSEAAIAWCKHHIEPRHPTFRFTRIDIRNARYNPSGGRMPEHFRLPYDDACFDIIYLFSVFSHLLTPDVSTYLKEFRRLLLPTGKVFLTAFLEEGVADCEENPADYRQQWKGALHCVRYDRRFFAELCEKEGLSIEQIRYATETDGQSAVTIARTSSTAKS